MKITAVIAEFNPFHNGHAYFVEQCRESGAEGVAAIMGGNFMQRGEPALLDKRIRAAAAVAGGVDLVLELPVCYAAARAEAFAFGGVSLALAMGCADTLAFGCECGGLSLLLSAVDALESPGFPPLLRQELSEGIPFAAARERAIAQMAGEEAAKLLQSPNNTLAVEYLKWIRRLDGDIQPLAVRRAGVGHDAGVPEGNFSSASLLREKLRRGENIDPFIPEGTKKVLERNPKNYADIHHAERAILSRLRTMDIQELAALPDVSEGLEHRLYQAARDACSYDEFLFMVKSKRYSLARIRRLALAAFLGLEKGMDRMMPPYLRVLAFNSRGAEILSRMRLSTSLPVSHSLASLRDLGGDCARFAQMEARGGDLYALTLPEILPCGEDYRGKITRMD